jgi:hypothetical protein
MAHLAQRSIGNRHTRRRKLIKTARKDAFFDSVFKNENLMRNILIYYGNLQGAKQCGLGAKGEKVHE